MFVVAEMGPHPCVFFVLAWYLHYLVLACLVVDCCCGVCGSVGECVCLVLDLTFGALLVVKSGFADSRGQHASIGSIDVPVSLRVSGCVWMSQSISDSNCPLSPASELYSETPSSCMPPSDSDSVSSSMVAWLVCVYLSVLRDGSSGWEF